MPRQDPLSPPPPPAGCRPYAVLQRLDCSEMTHTEIDYAMATQALEALYMEDDDSSDSVTSKIL